MELAFLCRVVYVFAANGLQLGEVAEIEAQMSVLHKCSIEELLLNLELNPPFCQTAVICRFLFIVNLFFYFVYEH